MSNLISKTGILFPIISDSLRCFSTGMKMRYEGNVEIAYSYDCYDILTDAALKWAITTTAAAGPPYGEFCFFIRSVEVGSCGKVIVQLSTDLPRFKYDKNGVAIPVPVVIEAVDSKKNADKMTEILQSHRYAKWDPLS